ncbi:MAG: beta-glucosidase BglX [Terriglobales bacterium]
MILVRGAACAIFLLLAPCPLLLCQQPLNPAIEHRIDNLLKRMTIEQKAGQLAQYDTDSPQHLDLVRQGKAGSLFNVSGADRTNAAQRLAVEQSPLKIPLLFGLDVIHGYRTIFPVPIGSASSFDLDLIQQAERVAAREATADGIKWVFAPMVDIARDPRWGRIVEGAGEDPYLGSMVAAARVRGFQGSNFADPQSVIACAKHFAAYGAVEGGRDYNTVDISEELLREVYLPPFHAAVKAGTGTIMSAFEDLNGVPATANRHTLTDILRGEWGFNGFVVSDYTSVKELIAHGIARDSREAAMKAIKAGVDMDMAGGDFGTQLPFLVKSGAVPMSVLDEAVRRVLRVKFEAELFDNPYTDPRRAHDEILSPANLQLERKLAQESIILLKNENGLLPLNPETKTIAVIGPLADSKADQLGPWASNGRASDVVTPLEGIKARLPNAEILYAKGTDIPSMEKVYANPGLHSFVPAPTSATGAAGAENANAPANIQDAVSAANKADVVIMFLGELAQMTGEASSRASLDLPGKQQELLEAVVATGKPIVLVLESGRPLHITWAKENDHVPAIMQAWFPGVQAGNAIADLLFGDAAPSARLTISWPRSVGQIPIYYDHKNTGRPSSPNRWHTGYLDESSQPLFPFGYGLTYTTFKYDNLHVASPAITPSDTLRVSAEIENTGKRPGTEVVQLYVHDRVADTSRPVRELKGFQRITLVPGEHKTVDFSVKANDLGSYDPNMKWVVPPGTYDVWVAPNAVEGITATFEVGAK